MRLLDVRLARRIRAVGWVLLAVALALLWVLPAASRAIQLALTALLAAIVAVVARRLLRTIVRTRHVPGFFWREYRFRLAALLALLCVAGGLAALLWLLPPGSFALRAAQSAVLLLCALADASWTVAITMWIWDRRRPGRGLEEKAEAEPGMVVEMRDQDGSRTAFPDAGHAMDWLDVMRPGDGVTFLCLDGGRLEIAGSADGSHCVRCLGKDGSILANAPALPLGRVRAVVLAYLAGGAPGSVRLMAGDAGAGHRGESGALPS
jgi:hypothetical protein